MAITSGGECIAGSRREIVVAMVDGMERRMKRFYSERRRVRLQPRRFVQPIFVDKVGGRASAKCWPFFGNIKGEG